MVMSELMLLLFEMEFFCLRWKNFKTEWRNGIQRMGSGMSLRKEFIMSLCGIMMNQLSMLTIRGSVAGSTKTKKQNHMQRGEGHSLMVADFVSADYGWMCSCDKTKTTRILFRAGKGREGYFTNENIRAHLAKAAEIQSKDYPDEDHVLIFDKANFISNSESHDSRLWELVAR
jgi:hypothetical protein